MYTLSSNPSWSWGRRMPFRSLLLTLIAVATTGYVAFRYLATQAADGNIVAVRPYCALVTCSKGCNSGAKMACTDIPAEIKSNQRVRRFNEGRVEFVGRDGRSRASWAEFDKLGKGSVRVGDRVRIHYIDVLGDEPEITVKPSFFLTVVGIGSFLFFLSVGARLKSSRWEK